MGTEQRVARLRTRLEEEGLGGIFVSATGEDIFKQLGANRNYLSGFSGSLGHLLVTLDAAYIAVDFRYFEQAKRESPSYVLFEANGGMRTWPPAHQRRQARRQEARFRSAGHHLRHVSNPAVDGRRAAGV